MPLVTDPKNSKAKQIKDSDESNQSPHESMFTEYLTRRADDTVMVDDLPSDGLNERRPKKRGPKKLVLPKANVQKFSADCECGTFYIATTKDFEYVVGMVKDHGCVEKSSIDFNCKCGTELQCIQIRDLHNIYHDEHPCNFVKYEPVPHFSVKRVPSVESVQEFEPDGALKKWYCFQEECRTRVWRKYKSFLRLKNWTAHMEACHKASLSYENYLDAFQPPHFNPNDVTSEFGDLRLGIVTSEFGNLTLGTKKA